MEFRYFENSELDLNKVYVQKDNFGYKSFVKVFEYNGYYYTNDPLNYKCTSVKLLELEKLVGKEVRGSNSNGVFVGVLTSVCLPDGTFNHKGDCFVRWHQGQKNIPGGWCKLDALKF